MSLNQPCPDCPPATPSGGLTYVALDDVPLIVAQALTPGQVLNNQPADVSSLTGGNTAVYAVVYGFMNSGGTGTYTAKGSVQATDNSYKTLFNTRRVSEIQVKDLVYAFVPLNSQIFNWSADNSDTDTITNTIVLSLAGYFY